MMKKTIITEMDTGYTLDGVIENEIDLGRKWAELGWFENDEFKDGQYYYFSNWYGSEGGFYNEYTDELIDSVLLDDMEPEEAEKIQDNGEFVEYPIERELFGLHVDYDTNFKSDYFNEKYGEVVIRAEDGKNYKDGRGVYQYLNGLFFEVKLVDKD